MEKNMEKRHMLSEEAIITISLGCEKEANKENLLPQECYHWQRHRLPSSIHAYLQLLHLNEMAELEAAGPAKKMSPL